MKSEFYRQISNEQRMRKSTTKHKTRKEVNQVSHINPMRMTKGIKSQTRAMVKSIDLNQKMKQSINERNLRMSFSRPAITLQGQVQFPQLNEQSIVSICCKCQILKGDHQKQLKALKMHKQQENTAATQKYIQMEKKYLLKDNQLIKLTSQYSSYLKIKEQLEETIQNCCQQIQQLSQKCLQFQQGNLRMSQEIKRYQDQHKFFNHFLTAFVEQTKIMIHWYELFQKNYQQLPKPIDQVREDICQRKIDLDIMLRESISYQKDNFGISAIKESSYSQFFESQEDGSESFLKYLKNNPGTTKIKYPRIVPFTELKEKSCFSDAYTVNKENMDSVNRPSFVNLITSRVNDQIGKHKSDNAKDQYLRILLTQAQTIESNSQIINSQGNSKSNFSVEGSLLSSISKRIEHYIE